MVKKFDYDSVPGDYQYKAVTTGGKFRKFWHIYKIKIVKQLLKIEKDELVLDVGCGSGNLLFHINENAKMVYGADISEKALNFIEDRVSKNKIQNIKIVKIEGKELPFRESYFDKVISTELIEHLENPSEVIKECYRVLKPGGRLFITTPNYLSFWPILEYLSDLLHLTPKMKDEQHISKFNRYTLKKILKKHNFKILKIGSFYFLSPFFSLISSKLSKSAFKTELKHDFFPGMLLYSIAKK